MSSFETDSQDSTGVENTKNDLEEKIELLEKENNVLRTQFASAVKITDQLKASKKQNEEISAELRSANLENEDLQHRLEILQKSYDDLTSKYDKEQKINSENHLTEEKEHKSEIEKVKNQFKAELDSIETEFSNAKEANNALEIQHKSLIAKKDRLIDSLSFFLHTDFSTLDEVCTYIEDPSNAIMKQPQIKEQKSNTDVSEYKKKVKTLQKQLKKAYSLIEDDENEKESLKKQISNLESSLSTQKREAEAKMKQMEEEFELKNNDQQHQITMLSNKVTTLKSDIQRKSLRESTIISSPVKQTTPTKSLQTIDQEQQEKVSKRSQITQSRTESSMSDIIVPNNNDKEILELKSQKRKVEEALNQVQNQLKESKSEIQQLKTENTATNHVKEELIAEVDTLRQALKTPPKEEKDNSNKKYKKEIAVMKAKMSKLNAEIQSSKRLLLEAQADAEKWRSTAKEIQEKMMDAQKELEVANICTKKANSKAADLQRMLDDVKPPEEVPDYAFRVSSFDKELSAAVEKIGSNKSLQIVSRIQGALKQTASFYTEKLEEATKESEKAVSVVHSIRNSFGKFIVDLSIAATGSALTFDDFVSNNAGVSLVNSVSQIHTERDKLLRQNEKAQKELEHICNLFEIEGDVIQGADQFRAEFDKIQEHLQERINRVKQYKTNYCALQKKYNNATKDINKQLEEATNTIQKLTEDLDKSNKEVLELRKNVQSLNMQLREAAENREEIEAQYNEEREEAELNADNELKQCEQNYREEVELITKQLESAQEQLNTMTNENNHLKQVITSQCAKIEEQNEDYINIQEENKQKINDHENNAEKEKEQITQSYENAIAEIKAQSENMRSDIQKLSNDLTSANKKLKDTKETLFTTKRDKYRLEAELKAKNEELEREKALSKSNREVDQIEADTKLAQKIDQMIHENEQEKRELISYFANEFSEYSLATGPLDERLFKTLVSRVHNRIAKLTSTDDSIRRMINASPKQTTEDAVAQLLLEQ